MTNRDSNTTEHDRYIATEAYVRDVLRLMGQHADADDPRLVGRITSKIIRSLPVWAHRDSPLRLSDEELELGK